MTTIAVDVEKGIMAADSRTVAGGMPFNTRKVHRIETRRGPALIGSSGEKQSGLMFIEWYARGADLSDRPRNNKSTALVLDASGLWRYDSESYPYEVLEPYHAIGSGCQIAVAAMRCGKTVAEAVHLACELDHSSGGPVHVVRLAPAWGEPDSNHRADNRLHMNVSPEEMPEKDRLNPERKD